MGPQIYPRASVGVHFFLLGALNGNWASILPSIQSVQGLNDQILGDFMTCSIVGCMIGLPIATHISQKYGSYVSLTLGITVYAIIYPFLAVKSAILFGSLLECYRV
jgi:MFS family permease